MDPVDQLVLNPGVSEKQARGGAGMLFELAQDKPGGGQFAQFADKVSGVDDRLSSDKAVEGDGRRRRPDAVRQWFTTYTRAR